MKKNGSQISDEYHQLDDEELQAFSDLVEERRQGKEAIIRDKPKARQKDIQNTFDNMKRDVSYSNLRFLVCTNGCLVDRHCPEDGNGGILHGRSRLY